MKKFFLFLIVVLLLAAFTVPSFAAPWGGPGRGYGPCGGYGPWAYGEMNAEQKAEIDKMNRQLFEERKQMIERRVEWGYISRGEADSYIASLEQRLANNPGVPLYGGCGGYRGGRGGGYCW